MLRTHRGDLACLAVVAAGFALLCYFYFTGLSCSDDTRYLIGATKIAVGDPISTGSHAERRVMFLLPAALAYSPGRNPELLIAPYGLFFVGLGVLGYLLARQLLQRWAAAAAMLLAASQPAFFLHAGAMLPDLPATLFMTAALLGLGLWLRSTETETSGARRNVLALAIGASMAAAFTVKESALILLPVPLIVMMLSSRGRLWARCLGSMAAMVLGLAGVLALEAVVFKVAAGHWHSSFANLLQPHDFDAFLQSQGTSPLVRLDTLRRELGPQMSVLFLLALASTVRLAYEWRTRRLSRVQAWLWLAVIGAWLWPLLYFTYGTASLSRYMLPVIQQRYYAPCVVPAAILAVHLAGVLLRGAALTPVRVLKAASLCAVLLCLTSGIYTERRQRGLIYEAPAKEAFDLARREARRLHPNLPVYDVDSGWTTDLNRCRALLMPVLPGGKQRLLESLQQGHDVRGQFGYPDVAALQPPFLLLGHGPFLSSLTPTPWVAELQKEVNQGRLVAQKIGRYDLIPRRSLRGLAWLPRSLAVGRADEKGRPLRKALEAPVDPNVHPRYVELYLLRSGPRR